MDIYTRLNRLKITINFYTKCFRRIKTLNYITTVKLSKSGHLKRIEYHLLIYRTFSSFTNQPDNYKSFFSPRSEIQPRNSPLSGKNIFLAAYLSPFLLHPTIIHNMDYLPKSLQGRTSGIRPRAWKFDWWVWLRKTVGGTRRAYCTKIFSAVTVSQ